MTIEIDLGRPLLIKEAFKKQINPEEKKITSFIGNYEKHGEFFYVVSCRDKNKDIVIACFDLSKFVKGQDYSIKLKLFFSENTPSWASLGYKQDANNGRMIIFDIRSHKRRVGHGTIMMKSFPIICELMNNIIDLKNVKHLKYYNDRNLPINEEYPKLLKRIEYVTGDIKFDDSITENDLLAFYKKNNCLLENKVYFAI